MLVLQQLTPAQLGSGLVPARLGVCSCQGNRASRLTASGPSPALCLEIASVPDSIFACWQRRVRLSWGREEIPAGGVDVKEPGCAPSLQPSLKQQKKAPGIYCLQLCRRAELRPGGELHSRLPMVGGWRVGAALSSVSVGLWLLPRRGKGRCRPWWGSTVPWVGRFLPNILITKLHPINSLLFAGISKECTLSAPVTFPQE